MNAFEYALHSAKQKNIRCTDEEINILTKKVEQAFNKNYHAVCLSLGSVLNEDDSLNKEMLESIYDILRKHVTIIFVTGRGESSLKSFIIPLIEDLKSKYNISSDLLKNIIGVSNNGNFLFYTSDPEKEKYLDVFYNLIGKEPLQNLCEFKEEIINENNSLIQENYISYSYCKSLDDLLTSIRILVRNEKELENIEKYIQNILSKEKYNRFLKYDIGKYKGNLILQIGTSTKGKAIEEIEKFLGIPKNSILRIGRSGQVNGTDYEMLDSPQGFSINRCSEYMGGCFPVFDNDGNLLEGTKAIRFLLKQLKIFPTVCLEKPNRERYINQLAVVEKNISAGKSEIINKFNKIFIHKFNVNEGISDIFDKKSGALIFKDWEWELLPKTNKLKQLFENDDNGKYKYLLDTDSGKILRGADTYYYFLANKGKDQNISPKQIFEWWQNNSIFIKNAIHILKDFQISTPDDKRLVLAVLDNIKNIALLMLNARIVCDFPNENILLPFDTYLKVDNIKSWYDICNDIYITMGNLCFSEKNYIDGLESLLYKLVEIYKDDVLDILNKDDENLYKKCFRSYREIDNYIENYITMNLVIDKYIKDNPMAFNKGVNFTGVAYGGLELPFLAKNILQGEAFTSAIILKGKYKDRHIQLEENLNEKNKLDILGNISQTGVNIITDDNVLTGKTLQMAIDIFFENNLEVDNVAIVRYPSLNRVNQMFFEGHGAIDTTKFFSFIKGLIFPSPYSKIRTQNPGIYLDELGIFNKTRDRILRYLYKNGRFTKESEVASINKEPELEL